INYIINQTYSRIQNDYYGANKTFAFYQLLNKNKEIFDKKLKSVTKANYFLDQLNNWLSSSNDSNSIKDAYLKLVNKELMKLK
ncbi:hypothetical protein, partial [Ureaplasma diversum]|uniref:hypothetical protein n=1 Tax=Ureaplasma diversum TaxID=42094 RepID=UPI0005701037